MTALRILHVVPSLAPEAGGPPVVAAGLAAALAHRGHSVAIASVQCPGQSPITVDPLVTLHNFPLTGSQRSARSLDLHYFLDAEIRNFDILHLHGVWQNPTFAAARSARKNKVPYITTPHGMLDRYSIRQHRPLLKRLYWLLQEKNIHAHAAALHCLNQAEIDNAVPWIKNFPKFILPNGIAQSELDHLPPKGLFRAAHPEIATRPLILFLSRIHPKKGLDSLIPAWKTLADKLPEARLALAGTGDPAYLAHIDHLIAAHGLQQNILRVGQLTGPAKWQALVDADLFILPSHQEGFSMAITEALAASCPVLATQECNFPELCNAGVPPASSQPSETGTQLVSTPSNLKSQISDLKSPSSPCGIIILNHDLPAFTAAALDLLTNPAQRSALAAAARPLIQSRFTWENIAAQLEPTYRQLLAQ